MKLIIYLTILSYATSITLTNLNHHWKKFKLTHNKIYKNEIEELRRFQIYTENLKQIKNHNKLYKKGLVTYKKGINKFGDMTKEEFISYVNRYKVIVSKNQSIVHRKFQIPNIKNLAKTIDWRIKKIVTHVKDQGSCGSCWSFSATGSLEGQYALKRHVLISLSEQNLLDCSWNNGNSGCDGGWMDNAFKYVAEYGITTDETYPYEGVDGNCRYNTSEAILKIQGFADIEQGNETQLQIALAIIGPISVAIDATFNFQFYSSGYFNDNVCSNTSLNHGVLAVGYGTENGTDYWLIKNSWGASWGEKGYIKMARNRHNRCGIATSASFPII